MKKHAAILLALVLLPLLATAAAAQAPAAAPAPATHPAGAGDAAGFKADVLANFDAAANKLVQLAEAIPQEKYGWSPAPGVRTVAQVFLHVAGGNYFLGSFLGNTMPEGVRDIEKETDKAKVIATLKAANDAARKYIQDASGPELSQTVDMFGRQQSKRAVLMSIASHAHEHLGQAIAYARSVGVTPPWSKKGE